MKELSKESACRRAVAYGYKNLIDASWHFSDAGLQKFAAAIIEEHRALNAAPRAPGGEAVELQIEAALAKLPEAARARWVKLDKLPYIHATDDLSASPWGTPVVGRFDYLETADYMLACCPPNMRALLATLAAQQEEVARLRGAAQTALEGMLIKQRVTLWENDIDSVKFKAAVLNLSAALNTQGAKE